MAEEMKIEYFGSVPLDPLLARCCDEGKNPLVDMPDSPSITSMKKIVASKEN